MSARSDKQRVRVASIPATRTRPWTLRRLYGPLAHADVARFATPRASAKSINGCVSAGVVNEQVRKMAIVFQRRRRTAHDACVVEIHCVGDDPRRRRPWPLSRASTVALSAMPRLKLAAPAGCDAANRMRGRRASGWRRVPDRSRVLHPTTARCATNTPTPYCCPSVK